MPQQLADPRNETDANPTDTRTSWISHEDENGFNRKLNMFHVSAPGAVGRKWQGPPHAQSKCAEVKGTRLQLFTHNTAAARPSPSSSSTKIQQTHAREIPLCGERLIQGYSTTPWMKLLPWCADTRLRVAQLYSFLHFSAPSSFIILSSLSLMM